MILVKYNVVLQFSNIWDVRLSSCKDWLVTNKREAFYKGATGLVAPWAFTPLGLLPGRVGSGAGGGGIRCIGGRGSGGLRRIAIKQRERQCGNQQ
jgi:hypothetical protein